MDDKELELLSLPRTRALVRRSAAAIAAAGLLAGCANSGDANEDLPPQPGPTDEYEDEEPQPGPMDEYGDDEPQPEPMDEYEDVPPQTEPMDEYEQQAE